MAGTRFKTGSRISVESFELVVTFKSDVCFDESFSDSAQELSPLVPEIIFRDN